MIKLLRPQPEESVHSVICRYQILGGGTSGWKTIKALTGCRGYISHSGLPTRLSRLAANIGLAISPRDFMYRHTDYALYAHFLSAYRRHMLEQAMMFEGATKSRLGLLRAHVGAKETLRYCGDCSKEDLQRLGFSYWYRGLGTPGLLVCPRHGSPLRHAEIDTRFVRQLSLPGPVTVPDLEQGRALEALLEVSRTIVTLLRRPKRCSIAGTLYHRIFEEFGLRTVNGRIRQREVLKAVKAWLLPVKHVVPYDSLWHALDVERDWTAGLSDRRSTFHHPLKHIILWSALGLRVEDILSSAASGDMQLEMDLTIEARDEQLVRQNIRDGLSAGASVNTVARELGCSPNTVTAIADIYGIPYIRRTKFLHREVRQRVLAFCEDGHTTSEAAERFQISISSVNRIRRAHRVPV